jgi:hypothetical protein
MNFYVSLMVATVSLCLVQARPQHPLPGIPGHVNPPIPIISQRSEASPDGSSYAYAYETANGIKSEQIGQFTATGPEEGVLRVQGSEAHVGDDGQTYSVQYTADENGFNVIGAHLPTPPAIPPELVKSIQEALADQTQYDERGFPLGSGKQLVLQQPQYTPIPIGSLPQLRRGP